jgi:hypothetical protein
MATSLRYLGTTTAEAVTYVREAVGEDVFARVFDLDGNGTVATGSDDEKAFVRAGCAAETEIDEALAASHGAPFTGTVPDSVREIAAMLLFWCAVRYRPSMKEESKAPYRLLYKDAMARLKRLADDNRGRIPTVGAPQPVSSLAADDDPPATPWGDLASGTTSVGFG